MLSCPHGWTRPELDEENKEKEVDIEYKEPADGGRQEKKKSSSGKGRELTVRGPWKEERTRRHDSRDILMR